MTCLSVNINKAATLRNARGGNNPDLLKLARDCERFGAQGITVHPRPDERHIRYSDVHGLAPIITTEFNIEGYPNPKFIELVLQAKPIQVTLVPDPPNVLTSNAGWNAKEQTEFLTKTIATFKSAGIRTSLFMDPDVEQIEAAATTGTDRIELYTEAYATGYTTNKKEAIAPYVAAASRGLELGLEINAGHDLDLFNLRYFYQNIPGLKEVSIGHALFCDAIYYGLENTIQMYLRELRPDETAL